MHNNNFMNEFIQHQCLTEAMLKRNVNEIVDAFYGGTFGTKIKTV